MAVETKKFRNRLHVEVEPFDVKVGDIVEFISEDAMEQFRVGRVEKLVTKGRGKKKALVAVRVEAQK